MDGTEGAAAQKARLRTELLDARRARSAEQLAIARDAVRRQVLERAVGAECVAAYVPLRTEPGSAELLADLRRLGLRVLVPVTLPDRDLDWTEWGGRDGGLLGVEAVREAGLALVPALAVATDGTRLGRGGGSYDRALGRCGPEATVAALLFDDEVLHELPRDPWDRPVGFAVTPSGWVPLGRNVGVPPGR